VTPPPVNPNLWRAITLWDLVQMGRVSSPSACTRCVDVKSVLARSIWSSARRVTPFGSSEGQTGTKRGDFGWKWVVFQNPRLSKVALRPRTGGSAEYHREYYRRGWSPSSLPLGALVSPGDSRLVVWLHHHSKAPWDTCVCVPWHRLGESLSLLGHSWCVPSCVSRLAMVWM